MGIRTCAIAAWALVQPLTSSLGGLVIWPSMETTTRATEDATIAFNGEALNVHIDGGKAAWPGVFFETSAGEYDLRAFSRIDVVVSNRTDQTIKVSMSVKCIGGGQRNQSIRLSPRGGGTIRTHIGWTDLLDNAVELPGLRHKPTVSDTTGRFDPMLVRGVHIFMSAPTQTCDFAVLEVAAKGVADRPLALSADALLPLVDEYGQPRHGDWPGKVWSDAGLAKAREAEEKWLAKNVDPFSDRNRWGGWKDGPKLEATGTFRTEKVNGKWWLVDPDGNLFWSHGVTCVGDPSLTRIGGRETMFQSFRDGWNSPFADCAKTENGDKLFDFIRANIRRKNVPAWGGDWKYPTLAHARLRAWGLNTIGDWSHVDVCLARKTPYTVDCTISCRKLAGNTGYLPDPFADDFCEKLAGAIGVLRKAGVADDPWCIGFFVHNEMQWGDDDMALARAVVKSPADQPAKREMLRKLMAKYDSIGVLNAVWGTDYASWDAALESTSLPDDAKAAEDFRECHRLFAEEYFRRVAETIHREAPGRLYLGCRFYDGGDEVVYRAAAKFCDVVSMNIYYPLPVPRHGDELGFPDCPVIVGEFHFHARGRGYFTSEAGLTPEERIVAYREYVECALRDPRFVGTHWFQWWDQPLTGRSDGENFPCGFLDVCDIPHADLVKAAREIAAEMYPLRFGHAH